MLDNEDEPLLSRKQAAIFLNRTEDALATMNCDSSYNLPFIKRGKLIFYRISDLEKKLRDCE